MEDEKKIVRRCGTHHAKNQENARVARDLLPTVTDNPKEIISIGIIFHIFYTTDEKSAKADANAIVTALNRDYGNDAYRTDPTGSLYKANPTANTPSKLVYKDMLRMSSRSNIKFTTSSIKYVKLNGELADDDDMDAKDLIIKGSSPSITPESNLNIWIVKGLGGGLLGYATFPWDFESNKSYDGVVLEKGTVGAKVDPGFSAYNLNRTVTHEVGHWLGLYHTFQSNPVTQNSIVNVTGGSNTIEGFTGDAVPDTPKQANPDFGNPLPKGPWPYTMTKDTKGANVKSWHMFMNYMDYTDDKAMFMFTKEQVTRMRLIIRSFRSGLLPIPKQRNKQ